MLQSVAVTEQARILIFLFSNDPLPDVPKDHNENCLPCPVITRRVSTLR